MRRALIACLTLALAFTGFAARPASAAETAAVNGTGSQISASFDLDPGIYEIDFSFSGPTEAFVEAWLVSDVEDYDDQLVAYDIAAAGRSQRIVLSVGEVFALDVNVADDVTWSATVEPVAEPTTVKTSLSVSGTGTNASSLYLLEKGTYSYTATYSGNVIDDEAAFIEIYAMNLTEGKIFNLVEEISSPSGKKTGSFTLGQRALVWIEPVALSKASWKVDAALNLTAATPTISGTVAVGKTLTAKPGTWKPSGATFTYQWLRDGKKISGATKSTYTLTSSDKGKAISVQVKGSKSGYSSVTKTSSKTKAVKAGTLSSTPTPKISGSAKVGKKLTAKAGTWKPSGVKLSYQWLRDGKKIKGATKSTYTVTRSDKGKKISVQVKGSKSGYTSVTKTSKKTSKV
ncbi:MAG: hypothetical protein QM713_10605 [Arachnia sp.]